MSDHIHTGRPTDFSAHI